jgi:hypothetical protein
MWMLAAIAAILLIARTYNNLQKPLFVFPTYYTAATLIADGQNIANFYDDDWFRQRTPDANEIYNANTPLMGFSSFPLLSFPMRTPAVW